MSLKRYLYGYFCGVGAAIVGLEVFSIPEVAEPVVAGLSFLIALWILISIVLKDDENERGGTEVTSG